MSISCSRSHQFYCAHIHIRQKHRCINGRCQNWVKTENHRISSQHLLNSNCHTRSSNDRNIKTIGCGVLQFYIRETAASILYTTKIQEACSSITLVPNYQIIRRHIPEDGNLQIIVAVRFLYMSKNEL